MRRPTLLLLPLILAACAPEPTGASWLQGFGVDWTNFNHRLAYLALRPTDGGAEAAFIGGASTTGVVFDDDGTCVTASTCWELPTTDRSILELPVVRATSDEVVLANGAGSLTVGADGGSETVRVPLPRAASGEARAWIAGFTLDATVPLPDGAASCYDPRHGWLPTRLGITVRDPELVEDGTAVDVPIDAVFAAGLSRESQRQCLDAVVDAARLALTVDLAVAVGDLDTVVHTSGQSATWPEPSDDQSPEQLDAVDVDVAHPEGLVGWRSLDWWFHETVDPGRGAYLRTLQVDLDPGAGVAFGYASNTSLTQLSGFDYRFEGQWLDVGADVETTTTIYEGDAVEAALDDDGRPVIQPLTPAP